MVNLAFSDEIVNATDLRNNQKFWLDEASRKPVTIAYGRHNLALLSREQISELFKQNFYLGIALQLCTGKTDLSELPWIGLLDEKDRTEFINEFIICIKKAIAANKWHELEAMLADWEATAETLQDKEVMKALRSKVNKKRYLLLK